MFGINASKLTKLIIPRNPGVIKYVNGQSSSS